MHSFYSSNRAFKERLSFQKSFFEILSLATYICGRNNRYLLPIWTVSCLLYSISISDQHQITANTGRYHFAQTLQKVISQIAEYVSSRLCIYILKAWNKTHWSQWWAFPHPRPSGSLSPVHLLPTIMFTCQMLRSRIRWGSPSVLLLLLVWNVAIAWNSKKRYMYKSPWLNICTYIFSTSGVIILNTSSQLFQRLSV